MIVEKVISRTRYWNFTVLVDFKNEKMNYGLTITVLLLVFSNVSFAARSKKGKSQKLGLISSLNEFWIFAWYVVVFSKLSVLVKICENSEFIPKWIKCLGWNSKRNEQ